MLSILSAVLVLTAIMPVGLAHSGRTDSSGGHHDYKNKSGLGSYHYHHGYSAHLHTGGYCPYTDVFPTSVTVSVDKPTLAIREKCTAAAAVSPSNACSTSVSWESSDTSIIKVNGGSIEAVGYGTATVTASTFNGKSGSFQITVKEIVPEAVSIIGIDEDHRTMLIGEVLNAKAQITPENVDNPAVTWTSSDESVASVTDGRIEGRGAGTVTIQAVASNGISAQIDLTVQEVIAEKVEVTTPETILIGEQVQLTAQIQPSNTTDQNIRWLSSDESIASISSAGLLTGKAVGDVTISAIQKDVQADVPIRILPIAVEEIVVEMPPDFEGTLKTGESLQLSAAVYPENATYPEITWSSGQPEIAEVDSSGLVTAVSKGRADILAQTADGAETTVSLEIKSSISPAAAVAVGGGGAIGALGVARNLKRKKNIRLDKHFLPAQDGE